MSHSDSGSGSGILRDSLQGNISFVFDVDGRGKELVLGGKDGGRSDGGFGAGTIKCHDIL